MAEWAAKPSTVIVIVVLAEKRGSIDLFWKGTLVVEHKSKGQDLDKAYTQALDYFTHLMRLS